VTILGLISCKKQDNCIETDWFERDHFVSNLHMEWAGSILLIADSVVVKVSVNTNTVFLDTMINEQKIIDLLKWDNYTVTLSNMNTPVQTREFSLEQRYEDCSNQDD